MLLHVTHETRYRYTPAVETAQHLAHLRPLALPGQAVLAHALQIEPAPALRSDTQDAYGNWRTFFALESTHESLRVVAHSTVRTAAGAPVPPPLTQTPWESVRESFRYRKGAAFDAASEFLFDSRHVPRHEAFAAYARPSFEPGRPLFAAAHDLCLRMHREMRYASQSTEINTPALEALERREGVCQDFAHIFIAGLRSLGLPARYVSGYLLTQPPPGQPRLVGADASHAWASVYLPGTEGLPGQWVDFDPTNGRQPGEEYVQLAIGRDFSDVSPIRGVLHGGAQHQLEVAVTVAAADESA